MRKDKRKNEELRKIEIEPNYLTFPHGSVLIKQGATKIICCVSIKNSVPPFLRGTKSGWLEAEYAMLPSATSDRNLRESKVGKQHGRTVEIQRIISRSLRNCLDLSKLEEKTLIIDCDVLEADGSTRTAAINGAYVALEIAIRKCLKEGIIKENPIISQIAAVSVGIVDQNIVLDLNFEEDSRADVDLNLVMNNSQNFVEIQGTAEKVAFNLIQFNKMIRVAKKGINKIIAIQTKVIEQLEV